MNGQAQWKLNGNLDVVIVTFQPVVEVNENQQVAINGNINDFMFLIKKKCSNK